MAVIVTPNSVSVSLKLNAGTDGNGKLITKSTSIPGLAVNADDGKIYNVADCLSEVLEFPLTRIQKTLVSTISNG